MVAPIIGNSGQIQEVVAVMQSVPRPDDPLETITRKVEQVRKAATVQGYTQHNIQKYCRSADFGLIGVASLDLLRMLEPFDFEKFANMLLEKHRRYGPEPLRAWGELGVMIRIHSKLERYRRLKDDPTAMLLEESVIDTLQDILGYAVLGYIMAKE